MQAADGSLYGGLFEGGRRGAIYRLAPGGALSIVHRFEDAGMPASTPVRLADGSVVFASAFGGEDDAGSLVRIDPTTGTAAMIYSPRLSIGSLAANVVDAPNGALYIVAERSFPPSSYLLRIDAVAGTAAVVHDFAAPGGATPNGFTGAPIVGPDGRIYGTAQSGGADFGGLLYRLDPATETVTILHEFSLAGGTQPQGLVRTGDGRLYGVARSGGANQAGTVFRVDPSTSAVTKVLDIPSPLGTPGAGPAAPLVEGVDGHLYGILRPTGCPAVTADFWYEAHNSPGSTGAATRWVVAGVETGGADNAETYVLIANPSARSGRARIQPVIADGTAFDSAHEIDLPPLSRTNVAIGATLPWVGQAAGVVVNSLGADPVPVVVERATYASPGGVLWTAGANALAAPLP